MIQVGLLPTDSYQDAVSKIAEGFKLAGVEPHISQAEALFCEAHGISWSDLKLRPKDRIKDLSMLSDYTSRRILGEPLAYIVQRCTFYGMEFFVNPCVLIPRPETEILVEKALAVIPLTSCNSIVDMGCGSGCIGLSLARNRPQSKVLLVDKSPEAIHVAQDNAKRLVPEGNIHFLVKEIQQDTKLGEDLVDIIVANPPYIPRNDPRVSWQVQKFEPHLALYAEGEGLEWIHKWLQWSYHNLNPQGHGFLEIGEGQLEAVKSRVSSSGLHFETAYLDYQQIPRVVHYRKV